MKLRLDEAMVKAGLAASRSQAENYIKLGKVTVDNRLVRKAGQLVEPASIIKVNEVRYVSRAALKLASVAATLGLDFKGKTVLDIGSSTGGFTDFALKSGAARVIAVDVGTDQMNSILRLDPRVELHEKTDIRDFKLKQSVDIILIDVSFISLSDVMPSVNQLAAGETQIVAMMKPQFEAGPRDVNKGVIKNNTVRRRIIKDFESWIKIKFIIIAKADSGVAGAKGNMERFYLLKKAR